ncbi:hypothetical protein Theos_2241 (plasmid) [Thermus oshimai JL-2]|jgi:hypothetical protein|uniref:Uncharacterized protein n=1 Tax=Thermus oshimai JL-2 TaxID=751945 RepID=K7RLG7_THEOS|nr:hypothetical protein [Thermus oshimai]AFV77232.1 hypothetical protein Theos_2241 [Thermus oshimai JL-2]
MGKKWFWLLAALGLAACSIPFSYTVNVLEQVNLSGTFTVGQGGISPNPKDIGPVEVSYEPDSRVTLSGATLNYKVCFRSQTPGTSFSGTLVYAAYLSGDSAGLFTETNRLAEGNRDISALSSGPVCVEGTADVTPAQVQAIASGRFYVGARISGSATSTQEATIRYDTERFELRLSGSVRP